MLLKKITFTPLITFSTGFMKKIILFLLLPLAYLFHSCTSNSTDSSNNSSALNKTGSDSNEVVFSTTFPQLMAIIDSAAKKDGNVMGVLNFHNKFIFSLEPHQVDSIYYKSVDGLNAYLDKNLPYIPENKINTKNYTVKKEFEAELNAKGIRSQFDGEGGFFPIVDQQLFYTFFNGLVTPTLQEFITFFNENDEYIAFDAGLVKTPQQIADRILFYDWHLTNYPQFPRKDVLLGMYVQEMYFVMFGLDNTPAFSYADNLIFDEHKEAFEILMSNGTPFTKKIIGTYVDALKINDWHYIDNGYDKFYFGIDELRKKELKNASK